MKKVVRVTLTTLLAIACAGCARATSQPADRMINPGDRIGGFLVTTGSEGDVSYNWQLDEAIVQQGNAETSVVHIPVGTKVNVSVGIFDSTFGGRLESLWSGHTYEVFIQDRPVNLQAFGPIDSTQPIVGKIRYWNVVITTTTPGEITVVAKGAEASGVPIDDTKIYTFGAE